jgi:Kdo2-lipid IVA lauroyltransferase/acyltransferase
MKERGRAARTVLGWLALAALTPLGLAFAWLPARPGLWVGARLGDLAWAALPRRRAVALENLARAFPEHPASEIARIGRGSFRHLGMNFVESCVFFFRPPARLLSRVSVDGVPNFESAAVRGRGMIMLTAHFGNWELLAASHALTRFSLSVVVRPLDSPLFDPLLERFRRRSGVELITKRRALSEIVEALRRRRMVGILLDQNASRREGVFVPFFGVPASTSKGMALIALRTGAPVLPVFIRRRPDGHHVVEVGAPVPVPPDGDVVAFTHAFNEAIEAAIRRAPEQWFWLHRRWKTRPLEGPA